MVFNHGYSLQDHISLNRPHFNYKSSTPPIPSQSKEYINIANYNIRTAFKDIGTSNSWKERKEFFFETIRSDDEAYQLMGVMKETLRSSISKYLKEELSLCSLENSCKTCDFSSNEPFPVFETKHYRIALKTSFDNKEELYGNFPYPFRLLIALKNHAQYPSEEQWEELRKILETLDTHVRAELGAEYTSYGIFQDVYYRDKDQGKPTPSTPHFIIHFIFRFPHGKKVNNICFEDPNPFEQFEFVHPNLIQADKCKPNSNFIFKRSPDIINIQELNFDQVQDLKKELPNHQCIGYSSHEGVPLEKLEPDMWIGECLAIAYRSERLVCLHHGVKWLSSTPNIPSKLDGSSRNRIIIWAEFRDLHTNKTFFVFNVHSDHLGGDRRAFIDAEVKTINEIAKDSLWIACGERFYKDHDGENLYQYYLDSIDGIDARDKSLFGHYGEAGSWGGFEDDPYLSPVKKGSFECDTLDVCFTNSRDALVLYTYSFSGAYDPMSKQVFDIADSIHTPYKLASDHFMTGFYFLLQ